MISTYEQAWDFIQRDRERQETLIKQLEQAAEAAKPRISRSGLRDFVVRAANRYGVNEGEFTIQALHCNSAYNKARRKLGEGCTIIVNDQDRVLTGVVALE